jgi:hypothetical protein
MSRSPISTSIKRIASRLVRGWFALILVVPHSASAACRTITVPQVVEVASGAVTLADLLYSSNCPVFSAAAAEVRLGAAPQIGSMRVFEAAEIRRFIDGLKTRASAVGFVEPSDSDQFLIPDRVVVRRAVAVKSCLEIARFLAGASERQPRFATDQRGQPRLNCGGASSIPENASLELLKITPNPSLRRWEFSLRCLRTQDCAPFLVWQPVTDLYQPTLASPVAHLRTNAPFVPLVGRGQTSILTWEQAGIRIVLPVTCLEAGAAGQLVWVRLQNAPRMLRARVTDAGTLRAGS